MTPVELFALICLFVIMRIAISLPRPAHAVSSAIGEQLGDQTEAQSPASSTEAQSGPAALSPSLIDAIREYLDAFIIAGLVALFLITFVIRTFFIPSGSMEPTLQVHDVLLVNEFGYRVHPPHLQDIAVFHPPIPTTNDFIKRVIGHPGDTLRIHQGIVYRNSQALAEPYIAEKPDYELEIKDYTIYVDGQPLDPSQANIPPRSMWQAPDRIPEGCYFMMGDNRNNSEDSHIWGFAQTGGTFASGPEKGHRASFTGHAFLLFWPPNRVRTL